MRWKRQRNTALSWSTCGPCEGPSEGRCHVKQDNARLDGMCTCSCCLAQGHGKLCLVRLLSGPQLEESSHNQSARGLKPALKNNPIMMLLSFSSFLASGLWLSHVSSTFRRGFPEVQANHQGEEQRRSLCWTQWRPLELRRGVKEAHAIKHPQSLA